MDNKGYAGEDSNGDFNPGTSVDNKDKTSVVISEVKEPATKPYAGMGKEDLLRFSTTPFWNRMRMGCVACFWILWICLLVAVVILTIVTPRCSAPRDKDWWETSVFYQVYVRSFYDSDQSGMGDIQGVIEKLDYIEDLNVNAIILSSFYQSHRSDGDVTVQQSQADYGYDVTDHTAVDDELGSMADLEELIEKVHERDMKVIVDFIPNHTGDKHPWFTESANDQADKGEKWNYYTWAECTSEIDQPTNWLSVYSEPAWNYSAAADKCYLHQFFNWQPELNLRSTQVKEELDLLEVVDRGSETQLQVAENYSHLFNWRTKEELDAILNFWLDKGVDGFRVTSVKYLFEDADLRDETDTVDGCDDTDDYNCIDHKYTTSQSEVYDMVDRWRKILEVRSRETMQHRLLITDAEDSLNHTMRYYGDGGMNGAQLPINYQLTHLRQGMGGVGLGQLVDWWIYNQPEDSSADWLTGHQDENRIGHTLGESHVNVAMMIQLTLPGPTITYYGEELGMINGESTLTDNRDPAGHINPDWSRDMFRTPMQWLNDSTAGFTNISAIDDTYIIWITPNEDYTTRNVEAQTGVDYSPLTTYRRLTEMHRYEEGLHHGSVQYALIDENIFSFIREYEGYDRFLVVANFGTDEVTANFKDSHYMIPSKADVVFRTGEDMDFQEDDNKDLKDVFLRPGDGAIFSWSYTR